jgi:8-oxo-dGTP pyrophosphatase MutT (NUDIX family)
MKKTTLCFFLKGDKVLLAMKKRGFGVGKWNGIGGKVKDGEILRDAAVREIAEEIGVVVMQSDLIGSAILHFTYKDNPGWEQECHVYIIKSWRGEPIESEEMKPQWYSITDLPFVEMWIDDPHWLPRVLAGEKIEGEFLFDETGGAMLDFKIGIKG